MVGLQLLAVILAAMGPTRIFLHVHVHPAPVTQSALRRSGRLRATAGSATHTSGQGLAPAPRGTDGLSNCCEADRGDLMSQADVEGVECSTHEAVADSSYVEETGHVDKRAFEAIGSDNEDEILRLFGDTSSGTDLQRADVHVQPGEALAERGAGVQPPC